MLYSARKGVSGIEPLFFPEDEAALLPRELHAPSRDYGSRSTFHKERRGHNSATSFPGVGKAAGYGTNGGGGGRADGGKHQRQQQQQQQLPYDRHSVHVVTQYYIPEDPHRAREVGSCGTRAPLVLCAVNALLTGRSHGTEKSAGY